LNVVHLYNIGCVYSKSSAVANRDGNLSAADRTRLKAQYADRAMSFVRQVVAIEGHPTELMKTDPDLDPLRAREDFQKLLADLEVKEKEASIRNPELEKKR